MSRASFGTGQAARSLNGQVRSRALSTALWLGLAGQSEVRFLSFTQETVAPIEGLVRSDQVAPHYWQASRPEGWRAQILIPKSGILA